MRAEPKYSVRRSLPSYPLNRIVLVLLEESLNPFSKPGIDPFLVFTSSPRSIVLIHVCSVVLLRKRGARHQSVYKEKDFETTWWFTRQLCESNYSITAPPA